jgi:hypothetical protein
MRGGGAADQAKVERLRSVRRLWRNTASGPLGQGDQEAPLSMRAGAQGPCVRPWSAEGADGRARGPSGRGLRTDGMLSIHSAAALRSRCAPGPARVRRRGPRRWFREEGQVSGPKRPQGFQPASPPRRPGRSWFRWRAGLPSPWRRASGGIAFQLLQEEAVAGDQARAFGGRCRTLLWTRGTRPHGGSGG